MTILRMACLLTLLAAASALSHASASLQADTLQADTIRFTVNRVVEDSVRYRAHNSVEDSLQFSASAPQLEPDELLESMPLLKNVFRNDWMIYFTGGVHTFRGDYSRNDKFSGTISPEITAGVGYWFNPYVGLALEFIRSQSRGYSEYVTGDHGFGYGELLQKEDGTYYRKMKTHWWDVSCNVKLNLTRLLGGYEGYGTSQNRNQIIFNGGMGLVHHLNYEQEHGTGYDWSGHAELQYSRFFGRNRHFSLDLKFRMLFYHTNFDYESRHRNRLMYRMDGNIGIHAGFTVYIGKLREKKKLNSLVTDPPYNFGGTGRRPAASSQASDVIDYQSVTATIAIPAATGGSYQPISSEMLSFPDSTSAATFNRLYNGATVTQIDIELPDGVVNAEEYGSMVEQWLKGQDCFKRALYQSFKSDTGNNEIKIKIFFLAERRNSPA